MIPRFEYIKTFSDNPETYKVGEWDIPLPEMPLEKDMWNYDKKINDQVYPRLFFPKNFKFLPKSEQDEYARTYLVDHRNNGRWVLIKGQPLYMTPEIDVYYSFWHTEKGGLPDFRIEGLEYFYLLDFAWWHPRIFGTVDIKPRRIGDTDKTLSFGHQGAIRYKKYHFGMQNMKDEDAKKNYLRLLNAHKRLPPIYKPILPGKDDPQEGIEFKYPGSHLSRKMLEEKTSSISEYNADILELNSIIDYRPTRLKEYDGQRLSFWHFDEPGKVTNMDVKEQIGVIRRCISLNDESLILGKMALTTTIEELKDGKTVRVMQDIWDDSSPEQFYENGRTISGLIRIVRTTYDNAPIDKFGFPLKEQKKKEVDDHIQMLKKANKYAELTSYLRRSPRDIFDALKPPETDVDLLPEKLDQQLEILKNRPSKAVRGNLFWKEGTMWNDDDSLSEVGWRPDPKGRWFISQHPISPCATKRTETGNIGPAMKNYYAIGVDPTDTGTTDSGITAESYKERLSKQAIVVERIFDPSVDNEESGIKTSGAEILNPEDLQTGKPVCTYLFRHSRPVKNFEDVALTVHYYSSDMLIERNRTYVINKFKELGLSAYLQFRPKRSYPDNARNRKPSLGIHADAFTIDLYVDLMVDDIDRFVLANEHVNLLECQRQFNRENRSKRDLSVARGFCKIAALSKDSRLKKMYDRKEKQSQAATKTTQHEGFHKYERIR